MAHYISRIVPRFESQLDTRLGSYPMKAQFRQDLLDEVNALVSSIGEEYVIIEEDNKELQGTISVVLDPSPKPILFSAKEGKDYRQFETVQLPPLEFIFSLPAEYPCEKPKIDVESIWMPNAMKEKLLCRLDDVFRANTGSPVLYLCYDAIKKFVAEMGTFEVRLDSNDFSQKHNLSAIEMLKLVREESEKAEMNAFLAQCHDCEVCFENKPGLHCVSPLTCLADNCESSASQKVIIELLGQKEFDRYERILLKKALERMDDMVTCPRISCQKPSAVSETTEFLATCLVCGYNFCTACYRGYHGVQPCFGSWGLREVSLDEYLLASQKDRMKMAEFYGGIEKLEAEMEKNFKKVNASTYAWIHVHSKRCPQCHIPIQRQSGCNILLCSMCGTRFCFNCDAILGKKNYVDHFMDSPECGGPGLQIPLGD
nr:RWD and Zinc finger domain containing protein [Haemonchus contortus]